MDLRRPLQRALPHLPLLLAGMALWLWAHRYQGIWNDASIYTALALHWLRPGIFAGDPWFVAGSADGLSLFIPFYGTLIDQIGIAPAAMLVVLAGGLLWLLAVHDFCISMLPRQAAPPVFLLFAAVSLDYSLQWPMYFPENFATARLLAIPLGILGVSRMLRGRPWQSLGLHGLSLAFHPLMALGAAAVSLGLRIGDRACAGLAALSVLLLATLAVNPLHLPPLMTMDPDWQRAVRATAGLVLYEPWPQPAIGQGLWCISLLLLAARWGSARLKRVYLLSGLVAAGGLLLSLLTSYFHPAVLFVQAQFWRAFWLALFATGIAGADLACRLWPQGRLGIVLLALLGLSFHYREWGGFVPLLALYGIDTLHPGRCTEWVRRHRSTITRQAMLLAIGLLIPLLPGLLTAVALGQEFDEGAGLAQAAPMAMAIVLVLVAWLGVCCSIRWHLAWRLMLPLAALAGALVAWDQRDRHTQQIEARFNGAQRQVLFEGRIRAGDTVYWPGNGRRVWFELGTASYASQEQATGIVFSRQRMEQIRRRLRRVILRDREPASPRPRQSEADLLRAHQAALATRGLHPLNLHAYEMPAPLSRAGLIYLCQDPELRYVLDTALIPPWPVSRLDEDSEHGRITHYLYDCRLIAAAP